MVAGVERTPQPTPVFPLSYEGDSWTCPVSGLEVPKDEIGNLEFRERLATKAMNDEDLRLTLMEVCRRSPLFWLNVFAWTERPHMMGVDGRRRNAGTVYEHEGRQYAIPPAETPVITWPAQDSFVTGVLRSFTTGKRILGDKSREQGFTILIMLLETWGLLYWPSFSALNISMKSDLVDAGKDSSDSLMGKVDYALDRLPEWMVPGDDEDGKPQLTHRHGSMPMIINRTNGARLIGHTSTENVGQSLRTMLTFVDEAARYPHAKTLLKSIESVGGISLLGSTPNGPGTVFSKLCVQSQTEEGGKALTRLSLMYYDHPQHGAGRTWTVDVDGHVTGVAGNGYWETPAFAMARASGDLTPRDWRENWLCDHDTSGIGVLDASSLGRMKRMTGPPTFVGSLVNGELIAHPDGRLRLWCKLGQDGRPMRDRNYVIGGDFSAGVEAANTVFAVQDCRTGWIVGEYVDPVIDPASSVPIATGLGYFFGGQLGFALIIWRTTARAWASCGTSRGRPTRCFTTGSRSMRRPARR